MTNEKNLPPGKYQKFSYDNLYAMDGNKTPSFESPKSDKASNIFAEHPACEYVKRVALKRLHKKLSEQLDFLIHINHCEDYNPPEMNEKLSPNVFSWSYDDFLKRRQLDNCVWIEVMVRNISPQCLEKQKAIADLRETNRVVDIIFKAICSGSGKIDENVELEKNVWETLRDAQQYLKLPEAITADQIALQKTLKEDQQRYIIENVTGYLNGRRSRLLELEDTFINSDVRDPIEVRYEIRWYQSIVKQNQYKWDIIQMGFENKLDDLKMKLITEKDCGGSIMDSYYSEVEQYKRRINDFQEAYDLEYDRYDNMNNYVMAQIDKLRDTKKDLQKEIERFHAEIQKRLEKEEKQRQEAELKRQEEEEAALALLKAKRQKKRRKAQHKGGPNLKVVKLK